MHSSLLTPYSSPLTPHRRASGFTLVELIVVITLLGILAAFAASFMVQPIQGFLDTSRRAQLVARAETALARITRELRLALPNSVRVHASGTTVEFLRTLSGGRYRREADPGAVPGDPIDFNAAADGFDVLGGMPSPGLVVGGGSRQADCLDGTVDCLVIYNTGQPGADAWRGDNIAAVAFMDKGPPLRANFDNSGDRPGWSFPFASPAQRFYIVDTPVAFVCDLGTGQVRRVAEYPITAVQSQDPPGTAHLLVDGVTGCAFGYAPGTATRAGLVTIQLTLSEEGESVHLLQQVHVPNVP